jgi:fructosamine-3-kinase
MITPQYLISDWAAAIGSFLGEKVDIHSVGIAGGGSINQARILHSNRGIYFAKFNEAEAFSGMLNAEASGLNFLKKHSAFTIPLPIATGVSEDTQWIVMEHISAGGREVNYWQKFGTRLAEMHRQSNDLFGLEYDNYLGTLPQINKQSITWADFYENQRLRPQLEKARQINRLSTQMEYLFEKLIMRIEDFFPNEAPAALHGDIWAGNFMTTAMGQATVFDPAVYFGHREMDLGMTKLFGGFDGRFYEAYHERYPLEPGWDSRIQIANLYPLLAHMNLFGGSYLTEVMSILRKYT